MTINFWPSLDNNQQKCYLKIKKIKLLNVKKKKKKTVEIQEKKIAAIKDAIFS